MHLIYLIAVPLKITILVYLTIKNEFQLFNGSEDVVKKNLSCLNINNIAGLDQIPGKSLKAADVLANLLSKIINLLIKQFIFLEECKISKPKLLFKKVSKTNSKNYITNYKTILKKMAYSTNTS